MKRLIIGLALIIILLGAAACGAPPRATAPVPAPAPAPAPAPGGIKAPMPPMEVGEAPPPVINIPPPAPAPAPTPRPAPAAIEEELGESWATERMIVRTGEMSLVVVDVANAIEQISALAGSFDGYVVSSNSWREGDRLAGAIAIRVDAQYFEAATRALRGLAVEVIQESTSSRDVTEEYVDLSAQLHNLEASEAQLLELMKQTGEVAEILDVQRELAKTRGQIERTRGRMQYLEQTSSTSLIQVYLQQAELDVSFSASNRRPKEGQDIYFEPRIAGGISPFSYEWDFGDGNTSTEVAPAHTYQAEGSYNVSLKVTDDRGNTDTKYRENYIEVLPGWSAGGIAGGAWNGLVAFGHGLSSFLIWLGIFSPVWIVIGAIIYFIYWWRRRRKRA